MFLLSVLRQNFQNLSKSVFMKCSNDVFFLSQKYHFSSLQKLTYFNLSNSSVKRKSIIFPFKKVNIFIAQRSYSKKKKGQKSAEEEEDDSDVEEEIYESLESDIEDEENILTKVIPSLRVDSVVKASLRMPKKKFEKEFYGSNIRVNGEKVFKKSINISPGDEIDIVKGESPENIKFLLVDRIVLKSVGKPTPNLLLPVKLQVFKSLTIENYPEPWVKSTYTEGV